MFKVVTTVNIKSGVVWDVTPCCLMDAYWKSRGVLRPCRQRRQVPLPTSVLLYRVTRRHNWGACNLFYIPVSCASGPGCKSQHGDHLFLTDLSWFPTLLPPTPPGQVLTSTSFWSHSQTFLSLDVCRARPIHLKARHKVKTKMVPRILDLCLGGYWRMVGFSRLFGSAASGVVLRIICCIGA
jgi:hypothetical protein